MSEEVQASAPTSESNETTSNESTGTNTTAQNESNQQKMDAVKELGSEFDNHKVTIVIDGEPQNLTVAELKKLTSLEKSSHKRFQSAADISKKAQEFWQKMEDPDEFFKFKGMNPVEYAEAKLKAAIEEAELSPEQKKAREKEQELSAREKKMMQFYEQKAQEEIQQGIGEAFKAVNLPKSPLLMSKIAATVAASMDRAKSDGSEPLTYQEAAVKVKSWFQNGLKETLTSLPPQEIAAYLGPDLVKKLKEHLIAQVNGPATAKGPSPLVNQQQTSTKPKSKKTFTSRQEWEDFVDGL